MPNAVGGVSKVANGNVRVSRFVKVDTSRDYAVIEATATTDKVFGIAQPGSKYGPGLAEIFGGSAPTSIYAAQAGDPLTVYTEEDECGLVVGTGGCTAGDYLGPETGTACGVTVTSGSYGAQALESASQGEIARVVVRTGKL